MAKYLTEEEVKKAEEQASLRYRQAAAEAQLKSASERARQDIWHEQLADAQKRRLDSMGAVAMKDPGRYSPITAQAAVRELERLESNRRFDANNTTRQIESNNAKEGQINAGLGAATVTAGANKEIAGITQAAETARKEKEFAASKELAGINTGSAEKIAESQNKTQREIAADKNKTDKEIAEQNRQIEQARLEMQKLENNLNREVEIQKKLIERGSKIEVEKIKSIQTEIKAVTANEFDVKKKMKAIETIKEKYKDDPEALQVIEALEDKAPGSKWETK